MTPTKSNETQRSTDSGLLTIEEVAARLRVPVETIRQWRKYRRGPQFVRIGGGRRLFCRESDLQAWIDAQFEGGAA